MCQKIMKFDVKNSNNNIQFNPAANRASRKSSYNDSVVVSANSISPGQLFSVRIEETENQWEGHIRLGLTILPDGILFPLPSFSIPNLADLGGCWLWSLEDDNEVIHGSDANKPHQFYHHCSAHQPTSTINQPLTFTLNQSQTPTNKQSPNQKRPSSCKCCLTTSLGSVPLYHLMSDWIVAQQRSRKSGLVHNILSIFYEVEPLPDHTCDSQCKTRVVFSDDRQSSADRTTDLSIHRPGHAFRYFFHLLVNGLEVSSYEDVICVVAPDNGNSSNTHCDLLPPVRAVVDVYGATKAVEIVDTEQRPIKSLQDMCTHQLVRHCGYRDISRLPRSLQSHLQVQINKLIHLGRS